MPAAPSVAVYWQPAPPPSGSVLPAAGTAVSPPGPLGGSMAPPSVGGSYRWAGLAADGMTPPPLATPPGYMPLTGPAVTESALHIDSQPASMPPQPPPPQPGRDAPTANPSPVLPPAAAAPTDAPTPSPPAAEAMPPQQQTAAPAVSSASTYNMRWACAAASGEQFYISPQLYGILRSSGVQCHDGGGGGIILCDGLPISAAAYTAATGSAGCEQQVPNIKRQPSSGLLVCR